VRKPKSAGVPARYLRLDASRHAADVEHHWIDGVTVPIYSLERTRADLVRYRRLLEARSDA
jgi:hypothetical protein